MIRYEFQKLTPKKNADIKIYEEALDFAISQDDIHNIAITGAYSAGKSSIIETYKEKKKDKKFLNISLANFSNLESSSLTEDHSEKTKEATIEGKILNQLIHQIKPENIPQTHFKVKKNVSLVSIIIHLFFIVVTVLLACYVWKFNSWRLFVSNSPDLWIKKFLGSTTLDTSLVTAGFILTIGCTYVVFKVIQMISVNKIFFRKLKVQGQEIEIFENTNESYFDKYLNEVLYLFENANADVIIFEDIDRFDTNLIFAKLREVNVLINRKSSIKIIFLYLIKDDTFNSKDRTKFFDFIIPIVPIVDGSNSYDKLVEYFNEGGILSHFDDFFLKSISLYIDDLRLLKNLYNEYLIYHGRIQSTELDPNRLLAIITYKNLFPYDFSELQLNKGFVYSIMQKKSTLINEKRIELEQRINELTLLLEASDNEHIENIDELESIYFLPNYMLKVNDKTVNQFENKGQFIKALKENIEQISFFNANYNRWQSFNFEDEYQKVLNNEHFKERKELLELKRASDRSDLQQKIKDLKQQLLEVESLRLYQLISKENMSHIFNITYINGVGIENKFEDIKSSPYFDLIKYLIRNRYIDESYQDYMTYFRENSLTRGDKIFLRSVTDLNGKEFSYPIHNAALVLSRIRDAELKNEEILNYNLLTFMLENNDYRLPILLKHVERGSRYDFIIGYCEHDSSINTNVSLLVSKVNNSWIEFAEGLLKNIEFTDHTKHFYLLNSFYYSSKEDLLSQNINECITNYVSSQEDFLNIINPNVDKLIDACELLNIRFKLINLQNIDKELFNHIYMGSYYDINFPMLSLILEQIYELEYSEDFVHKNFSLLNTRKEEPVVKYILSRMNLYVRTYLKFSHGKIEDEENVVVELLNNRDLFPQYKEKYIESLRTLVTDLSKITNETISRHLVHEGKISYTEVNILAYLSTIGLDDTLIKFINENDKTLIFNEDMFKDYMGDGQGNIFKEIVVCTSIQDDKYEMLIKGFNMHYKKFSHTDISHHKIEILIRNNVIYMSEANLTFIEENYPDHIVDFITRNIDIYLKEMLQKNLLSNDYLLNLLESESITDEHKLSLLEGYEVPISVLDKKEYSEKLISYILLNNFEINDLAKIVQGYHQYSHLLSNNIAKVVSRHISQIIGNRYSVPFQLLLKLIGTGDVEYSLKFNLFLDQFDFLSLDQVKECLLELGLKEFYDLFDRKRPRFEKSANNKQLLELFIRRGWINDYKTESVDGQEYYRAAGKVKIQESESV
ncbi:hypothetical protein QP794_19195 [Paenibacillus sp. UMB7766-LJ446]|uniref:YobI family P-loop NTPase n=1 Tax=Paenibacillus sp. UMB7766-LJ446 TaxID=3046313 RepID=UPI00254A974B|nr:hypothetical protein [Paenibacillus sp. UMB7766-LJ446]MDK8192220.1 hypothetical protein [Paenibacillus sp. UMB7766-LJ446]